MPIPRRTPIAMIPSRLLTAIRGRHLGSENSPLCPNRVQLYPGIQARRNVVAQGLRVQIEVEQQFRVDRSTRHDQLVRHTGRRAGLTGRQKARMGNRCGRIGKANWNKLFRLRRDNTTVKALLRRDIQKKDQQNIHSLS